MQIFAYQATERGIRERNAIAVSAERVLRLAAQRASYDADLAERERVANVRVEAIERAQAYSRELKAAGHRYRPTIAEIERKAVRVFNVSKAELHSHRRHRQVVLARQFVMYWAVRLTPLSLPQIGRLIGQRDHTTVLHGSTVYPQKRDLMGRVLRPVR